MVTSTTPEQRVAKIESDYEAAVAKLSQQDRTAVTEYIEFQNRKAASNAEAAYKNAQAEFWRDRNEEAPLGARVPEGGF